LLFDLLIEICFSLTEPALELFDRMLELDPTRRISATDALQSTWLKDINEDSIKPIEYEQNLSISQRKTFLFS